MQFVLTRNLYYCCLVMCFKFGYGFIVISVVFLLLSENEQTDTRLIFSRFSLVQSPRYTKRRIIKKFGEYMQATKPR